MAWSRSDSGYATLAAVTFSLALGLVVAGLVARAGADYGAARADLRRTKSEYLLSAGHQAAALLIGRSVGPGGYRWRLPVEFGGVEVSAEPETAKLSVGAAAGLNDVALQQLGVSDSAALRNRLEAIASNPQAAYEAVEAADAAPLWRACAGALVSPYGLGDRPSPLTVGEPQPGGLVGRAGELWRIRVTTDEGARDDRLVRFTGDANQPAAVVQRRMLRIKGNVACDAIWTAASIR